MLGIAIGVSSILGIVILVWTLVKYDHGSY